MKVKFLLRSALALSAILTAGLAHGQTTLPGKAKAGWANDDPGYNYGAQGKDITRNVKYWFVQNDSIIANISGVDVSNNQVGGIHRGVPMDLIHKRKKRDNIDWAQLVIHKSILADWDYASKNVNLDSIWMADSSVYSYGSSNELPKIKVKANYSVLDNAPVLKIKLKLYNKDTTAFKGYIEYQMDPDEVNNQRAWIPGLGDAPGLVSSGWTSNYIYGGSQGAVYSGYPNHGIAWVKSRPVSLVGSTIVFGAWFEVNIKPGDSTELEFYHITDIADSKKHAKAQDCIAQWAEKLLDLDPELSHYQRIKGKVEDVHGDPIKNMLVRARNTNAELMASAYTDVNGNYDFLIPMDVYTFTVNGLGYLSQSRSISISSRADSVLNFTAAENFPLTPIQVWAGSGKQMNVTGFVSCGEKDIIMENDKIALAIGVKSQDGQMGTASKGAPLDFIVKGSDDDLMDWINTVKMYPTADTADIWWQTQSVMMDTVFVLSSTSNEAKVRAEGRVYRKFTAVTPLASNEKFEMVGKDSLAFRTDISIVTEYTLKYGDNFVFVHTAIKNNSSTDSLKAFLGDIMDFDGTGEVSYVPGVGEVTGDFGRSSDYEFKPSAPWFAMYGAANLAYGMVYEGAMADDMTAFGIKRWMSNKKQLALAPNSTFSMDRYIIAASTVGLTAKSDAIANVYAQIKVKQSGIVFDVTHSNNIVSANDTVTTTIKVKNLNNAAVNGIKAYITPGYNVEMLGTDSHVVSLNAHDSATIVFKVVARTGGRAFTNLELTDHLGNVFERKISIFVKGRGWYAGDNHTHSKYSDGSGTIAENVESGYAKGLAFMTATDHNTHNQRADVEVQDAKYEDMIIMTGEEVTTSKGHCLAYNTGTLIPWNLNVVTQQQIIDSTNASGTQYGKGFMYLAHPHYPGLPWNDYTVRRQAGLEVWNGFYHATHSVNSLTFQDWDSLNRLGLHLLGISNSDAHNPSVVGKNYIMAYLEDFTKEEIIKSMRDRGTYFGTNGPLLNFKLENTMMGGNIKAPVAGRDFAITVEGNSNSTNTINEIRLLKNGKVIKTWNPGTKSAAYTITDNGKPNDFYRIELESGASGYAYSNPIWVMKGEANANLAKLSVDTSLVTGFDPQTESYTAKVKSASFSINAVAADSNATLTVQKPANVSSFNQADRTATITVLADDQVTTKIYTIVFDRLKKANANLLSLSVNGGLIAGFDSAKTSYVSSVQASSITISAVPADTNATVTVLNPVNIASPNAADRTAMVTVLADDAVTSKVYTIVFDKLKKADANLKSLSVDNTLLNGFDSLKLNYTMKVQDSSFTIQAVAADPNAAVSIRRPANVYSTNIADRKALIRVTAENQVTVKNYEILFEVETGITENVVESGISIFPVPASDVIYLSVEDPQSVIGYQVYNTDYNVVCQGKLTGTTTTVSLSGCKAGVHFVELTTRDGGKIFKKIIIIK